ncbi:MAG: hypothetical protein ACRC33_16835, partial [Gemmataceae bacterium]
MPAEDAGSPLPLRPAAALLERHLSSVTEMPMRTTLSVCLTGLMISSPPLRAGEVDWEKQMRADLPKAWKAVHQICAFLEGDLVASVQDPSPPHKVHDRSRIHFLLKDKRLVYTKTPDDKDAEKGLITGLNPNYFFNLESVGPRKYHVTLMFPRGGP